MELAEALNRINEIATGDKEQEAFDRIINAMETYRSLYEGAEKRLLKYRDIASRPDVNVYHQNKDMFADEQTARRAYANAGVSKPFNEWLFDVDQTAS